MRSSFHKAGRERRTRRSRSFFKATRLRNALNFSGSVPIASNSATNAVDYAKFFSRSRDAAFSEKTGSASGRFKNIGPKPIGLRSYLRLSGVLIKFSLITLPRRFNASSVALKPVGGLTFAETPLARSQDSTGAQSHLKRGRC